MALSLTLWLIWIVTQSKWMPAGHKQAEGEDKAWKRGLGMEKEGNLYRASVCAAGRKASAYVSEPAQCARIV